MGTEFFVVIDVFPVDLLACQVLKVLRCKLAKITLFYILNKILG